MSRLGADEFYFFPADYWQALADGLGERIVLVEARFGDELAAAALCFATSPWLHYHVSGTSERGREAAAANLVLFEAARWGQKQGLEQFHLGGGAGGREDTLFHFKRRFYPDGRREASVGKLVHDAEAYRSPERTARACGSTATSRRTATARIAARPMRILYIDSKFRPRRPRTPASTTSRSGCCERGHEVTIIGRDSGRMELEGQRRQGHGHTRPARRPRVVLLKVPLRAVVFEADAHGLLRRLHARRRACSQRPQARPTSSLPPSRPAHDRDLRCASPRACDGLRSCSSSRISGRRCRSAWAS